MRSTRAPTSSRRRYRYEAFGLRLESELPLPELPERDGAVDVKIKVGPVKANCRDPCSAGTAWSRTHGDRVWLFWAGVGTFELRGGVEITVDPDPEAPQERLRLFLLGAVIGVFLQQRGRLVLHASAASIGGLAVAFLGGKRSGKSTLAALLHSRGHGLIADDVVAIDVSGTAPVVIPGFPQIKLWPDSVRVIGADPADHPRLHPQFEKRDYRVAERFNPAPPPLRAVYVLDQGDRAVVEALDSHDALSEVISHWYCARFDYETLRSLGLSAHFLQSAQLVNQTPFYRLRRPSSLSALPEVASVLEESLTKEGVLQASAITPGA